MTIRLRSLSVCFIVTVFGGCKDLTFGEDLPTLNGVWTGALDATGEMTLVLAQSEDMSIRGSGFIASADTAMAIEVLSGVHLHPSVTLILGSDAGTFSLIGNRRGGGPLLRYGLREVTITGELNGPGFAHQAIVLTRQDSVSVDGA